MKQINRRMVLDCIRRRPISRAQLSDETQLTRASITQIVEGLIQEGLVEEKSSVDRRSPGRRQTQLAIVKNGLYIAGAYYSNKHYNLGLMNLAGEVVWKHSGVIDGADVPALLDRVAAELRMGVESLGPGPARIYSMGVCFPSPVEQECIRGLKDYKILEDSNRNLAEALKKRLGWDIFIGNISNAYALDELYFGIGREGVENFMVLRVDQNVGAGFIINGNLFMGAQGFSPEIGHITLVPNGPLCKCGNRGCLELYLATPAVLKDTPFGSWRELVDQLEQNDPHATEVFRREAELLAFEIVNLANVLDLEKIVITGDLVYGGERLAEDINRCMNERFVHRMKENSVVPGSGIIIERIAAMPAFHAVFA